MSTKAYVKDSSAYTPAAPYVRDSGSWEQVTEILGKAGGAWSSVFTAPGSLDRRFVVDPGFNERVYSTVPQSDGKILAGGEFTTVNGTTAIRIARISSDGTLD
ncbi:MAG: delta-60 repeat domain-containing protein, partial [Roseovarius sp.]